MTIFEQGNSPRKCHESLPCVARRVRYYSNDDFAESLLDVLGCNMQSCTVQRTSTQINLSAHSRPATLSKTIFVHNANSLKCEES